MPAYMVTDPETGRKVRLTGDSPPSDAELEQIFASLPPASAPTLADEISGGLETAGTILSGAVAEPAAGIAGLATGLITQDPAAAAAVVEGTRESLTFEPRSEVAKRNVAAIGETIAPAAELFDDAGKALGGAALDATGSPGLAAAAETIPTALLELAGAGLFKGVTRLKSGIELDKAIKDAAPTSAQLRGASSQVFKEISDLGVTVETKALSSLTRDIEKAAKSVGGSRRTTPSAFGVIDDFQEVVKSGKIINLDELTELRTVAQNAAKTIDPAQSAPAIAIIDTIDDFLESSGAGVLKIPDGTPNIGGQYKSARQIWGRARKSETLSNAMISARDTASGFENGIRQQFRRILNSEKKKKFFSAEEQKVMRQVSEGTKASNLAKLIGRLGFSEGQAINIVNPLLGGAAAGAVFGSNAGIAVPIIGQVSKQLAQRLTKGNADFAAQVVKAGSNAEQIAKAYLQNTPKAQRSAAQLSELFIKNEIKLDTAISAFAKDAAEVAKQSRAFNAGAVTGGVLKPDEEL